MLLNQGQPTGIIHVLFLLIITPALESINILTPGAAGAIGAIRMSVSVPQNTELLEYKTIWCRLENGGYFFYYTYPSFTVDRLVNEFNEDVPSGRRYYAFPMGFDPSCMEVVHLPQSWYKPSKIICRTRVILNIVVSRSKSFRSQSLSMACHQTLLKQSGKRSQRFTKTKGGMYRW